MQQPLVKSYEAMPAAMQRPWMQQPRGVPGVPLAQQRAMMVGSLRSHGKSGKHRVKAVRPVEALAGESVREQRVFRAKTAPRRWLFADVVTIRASRKNPRDPVVHQ